MYSVAVVLSFGAFVYFVRILLDVLVRQGFDGRQEPLLAAYDVVNTYPTDPTCFLQGFVMLNSTHFLQSCGLYGKSRVQISDLFGNRVEIYRPPPGVFLEGAAVHDGTLHVLTWKNQFVYSFNVSELGVRAPKITPVSLEGWGLTAVPGRGLVASNGTEFLSFLDERMEVTASCQVQLSSRGGNIPVKYLNHMTYDGNLIYANVYSDFDGKNFLLGIDPEICRVEEVLQLHGLHRDEVEDVANDVFNGAVATGDGKFLVTGKRWGKIYEIRTRKLHASENSDFRALEQILTKPDPFNSP
jgi:glutamine cyclotransferase